MSEVKHTPGPWIIVDNVQPPLPGYEARSSAKHIGTFDIKTEPCEDHEVGLWLGAVHPYECSGFTSKEQAAANAKLIAAAPDMLEAIQCALNIKDLWSAQQHGTVSADHAGEMEALQKMQDKLEAALAKATT